MRDGKGREVGGQEDFSRSLRENRAGDQCCILCRV